jgi:hypothetical protein
MCAVRAHRLVEASAMLLTSLSVSFFSPFLCSWSALGGERIGQAGAAGSA